MTDAPRDKQDQPVPLTSAITSATPTTPTSTLRNRRTTVEDADEDDSDSTPTATLAKLTSTATSSSTTAATKSRSTKENRSSSSTASHSQTRSRQQNKKPSQLRTILISLLIATLGVIFKSAYEKFLYPGREIAIQQTAGIQGNCYPIADIPGPEDIEISDEDQLAFVSSDDRSWQKASRFFHRPSFKTLADGGIFTLALDQKNATPKQCRLTGHSSEDFHPAGMSLFRYQDPETLTWTTRVFVINHSHKGDGVELFDYVQGSNTLKFVKRIDSDLFVTPKDIVAIDQDRFYLTNHHAMGVKYGRVAEDVAGFALGTVVYYNGEDSTKVLESLSNPYGVAIAPDASQLYVSAFSEKVVHVYNVSQESGLVHDVDIWVGNHVDNLSVDKHTGDIYVASHPSYSAYLRHQLGYEPQAPSHVVKIEKLAPENYIPQSSSQPEFYFFPKPEIAPLKWEVKDLFYSNGEDISALSVAAYWNNELLLGSGSSHHLLRCSLRQDA